MTTLKRGLKEIPKKKSNNFRYKLNCTECNKTKRTSKYKSMRSFQLEHLMKCGKHPVTEFL